MTDVDIYLDVAQRAVEIGYRHMRTSVPEQVRTKGDRDLVTEVDIRIEREIKQYLHEHTPEVEFLGEEAGGPDPGDHEGYLWILDPIDGTSNFAHGLPLCAVSLALVHRGEPIVGVITAPFLDLRYHAVRGKGAWVNDREMRASATTELSGAIVSVGDYATGDGARELNARRFAITESLAGSVERVRMFGSAALDLAWVAEGRTDASIMLSNNPWDTAGGVVIAREAGANVTDTTGRRHDFTLGETVATAPGITDAFLALDPVAAG